MSEMDLLEWIDFAALKRAWIAIAMPETQARTPIEVGQPRVDIPVTSEFVVGDFVWAFDAPVGGELLFTSTMCRGRGVRVCLGDYVFLDLDWSNF